MSARSCDVAVVGGGIIGLATAYQIARRSTHRVSLFEKSPAVAEGSTGASSAILRHRYTIDETVRLAKAGVECYRQWAEFTGLSEPRARFEAVGVLWMPGADHSWAAAEAARLGRLGIETAVLSDDDVREAFPALNTCSVAPDVATGVEHECQGGSACLLEPTGGFTDPVAAAEDLLRAARREGVDVRLNCEVLDVIQRAGHVTGLRLKDGETIATATLINASGPWCNRLIQSSGISFQWTLVPTRIQVMYLTRHDDVRLPLPVVADMGGGIYFRPQNNNQQIVVGSVLEADEREVIDDMDHFDRDTDQDFRVAKLHALHHRLPALPYRGTVRGYAGLYTINSQDAHPIVGPTELDGFLLANGFSGHGFKLAPAIGSLLAQFVTGTSAAFDTDVPITFLAKDRQPLVVDSKTALA